ncbi:MAG: hypothetical protein FRX49_00983 [Trebouxia sp. A1-2]|nr:MAG: hypothetical protein FRX49_00983 [Trebouxia sp. A1-2]
MNVDELHVANVETVRWTQNKLKVGSQALAGAAPPAGSNQTVHKVQLDVNDTLVGNVPQLGVAVQPQVLLLPIRQILDWHKQPAFVDWMCTIQVGKHRQSDYTQRRPAKLIIGAYGIMVQQDNHQLLTCDYVHRQVEGLIPCGMLALWLHRCPPLLTRPQPKPGITQSDDILTDFDDYDSNGDNLK